MITSRRITLDDYFLLENSLLSDEYHKSTNPEFFYADGTVCNVYEDEKGPVMFVRGRPLFFENTKIIQLDIQYLNNKDSRRNMRIMLEGFPLLEKNAKENNFSGFVFVSDVPFLKKFCIKKLGFKELEGDLLLKILQEDLPVDESSGVVLE